MTDISQEPTPEFLEAYRRITGSDDTMAATVFAMVYGTAALDVMPDAVRASEIQRLHAGIMNEIARAKAAKAASD
jgi:hypothetical protein